MCKFFFNFLQTVYSLICKQTPENLQFEYFNLDFIIKLVKIKNHLINLSFLPSPKIIQA